MEKFISVALRLSLVLSGVLLLSANTVAAEFAFIINAENNYAGNLAQAKQEVRQLFLKQKTTWPNGTKAKPLGPSSKRPAYEAFLAKVLNMNSAELAQHWLRVKQMTGRTPPREIKSDRLLTKMVVKNKGAFAVISSKSAAKLPAGAKILFEF